MTNHTCMYKHCCYISINVYIYIYIYIYIYLINILHILLYIYKYIRIHFKGILFNSFFYNFVCLKFWNSLRMIVSKLQRTATTTKTQPVRTTHTVSPTFQVYMHNVICPYALIYYIMHNICIK